MFPEKEENKENVNTPASSDTSTSVTPTGEQNPDTPAPDNALANLLGNIKNEQGVQKYDSVEKALEGAAHAQTFIGQLTAKTQEQEAELQRLRGQLEGMGSVSDIVSQLQPQQQQPAQEPQPGQPALSAEDVAALVQQQLQQASEQKVQTDNKTKVVNAMTEAFGEKAGEMFYAKAQEKGLTKEMAETLAANSPQAVIDLIIPKAEQFQGSVSGGLNGSAFQSSPDSKLSRRSGDSIFNFASTSDLMAESKNSADMVAELHAQGLETLDLSNPKVYAKFFGNL